MTRPQWLPTGLGWIFALIALVLAVLGLAGVPLDARIVWVELILLALAVLL
jgi:hypothetical protein